MLRNSLAQRRPGRLVASFAIAVAVSLLSGACTSGSQQTAQPRVDSFPSSGLLPSPASLPSAPAPLPRHTSATEVLLSGNQADSLLPNNNYYLSLINSRGNFSPESAPGGPLDKLSYAIFSLDISSYSGPQELHLAWVQPAPLPQLSWIGLAHYAADNWEWHAMPADGILPMDLTSGEYHNGIGLVRVAVVVAGEGSWDLDSIGFTANTPPVAGSEYGRMWIDINSVATIDASSSWDPDGSIVKYEFDAEGDGSFFDKGLVPNITHKYTKGGTTMVAIRVTDNEGASSVGKFSLTASWLETIRGSGAGNNFADLALDPFGDIIGAGTLDGTGMGSEEGYLSYRSSLDGSPIWEKSYGAALQDQLTSVCVDSAGFIYAAGLLNGDSGQGVLLKLGSDGSLIWHYEWSMTCTGTPLCRVDSLDNVYFATELDKGVGNPNTLFIAKLDGSAAIGWQREYERGDDSFLYGMCLDSNDNVYLAGGGYGFMPSQRDGLLLSFDSSANLRFEKFVDGGMDEELTAVCANGNTLIIGGIQELSSAGDSLLLGASLDGELSWSKSYSTSVDYEGIYGNAWPSLLGALFSGVARDSAGNLEAMVLCVGSDGTIWWQKGFGNPGANDQSYCVCDSLGRVILGGVLEAQTNATFSDLNGTVTDLSLEFTNVSGSTITNNARTLAAGSGSFADLAGATTGNGGAFMAQYFAPVIL